MKNILITVAGLTPQVITETIYCFHKLRNPPIKIDEVYVITTLPGKEKIKRELIENGIFNNLCKRLKAKITFGEKNIYLITEKNGNPLDDIRTLEHNEEVAETIWKVVEEHSKKEVRIHASVAGGRKTMGVYLAMCMSLLGRKGDTLSHVLVDEEKESSNFYFPKTKEEEKKLSLVEIPYIRMSEVLKIEKPEKKINFVQRIKEYEELLKKIVIPDVVIDYEEKKVNADEFGEVRFSEREFFLYSLMAEKRKNAECKCEEGCERCFLDVPSILEKSEVHLEKFGRYFNYLQSLFLDSTNSKNYIYENKSKIYEIISRVNTRIENSDILYKEIFKISNIGKRGNKRYGIKIPSKKLTIKREI